MKRAIDREGIRFKIWLDIVLFSLAIVALLCLLQLVFLNVYYRNLKMRGVERGANAIKAAYQKIGGQAFSAQLDVIANERDVFVLITDEAGTQLYLSNPVGRDYRAPFENRWPLNKPVPADHGDVVSSLIHRIHTTGGNKLMEFFTDQRGGQMILYGTAIQSSKGQVSYLIIVSPLQPLRETVRILGQQLLYISLAIFVLSLIVSTGIAARVSRPLRHMREKARLLAAGQFDVVFDKGDYSEVNALADTLNYAARGLQQVDKLRNELVANVSHDLRTPLTMIRLYAEMIRDLYDENKPKRHENVAIIVEECDRLSSFVEQLLDLSKLQAGAVTLFPSMFDLTRTTARIVESYQALAKKSGVAIAFGQMHAKPVFADEMYIEQVIRNLLQNALAHAGANGRVDIALNDRGERVRVLISDTGEGIPPDQIDKIWDRYYSVRNGGDAIGGTGLGLSIVRSILEQHNARYGVDSIPGNGTTFWFELRCEPYHASGA